MSVSSLQNKTIRPGRLVGYSYYYSNRRPVSVPKPPRRATGRAQALRRWTALVLLVLAVGVVVSLLRSSPATTPSSTTLQPKKPATSAPAAAPVQTKAVATPAATNYCAGNQLSHFILVSISQRYLWACQGATSLYDTPVVTGIDYLAADKTPTGSYQIYAKQTNVTLAGSDTTGSWSDPVSYWMPFLHNQYGSYGLHDATWRDNSAFGNISPNSADASHGCVELPLSAAAWLYNWAPIDTTVTIES